MMNTHVPFIMLRARDLTRGECINAGVIVMLPDQVLVGVARDAARLKALHPDFAALDLPKWAERLQSSLKEQFERFESLEERLALLPLFTTPFVADEQPGMVQMQDAPEAMVARLLEWQVEPRRVQVRPKREAGLRQTRLHQELREWLKQSSAFSTKIEDLSRKRVVANYPVDPATDLYADLALMNGQLNVMEIMDLRGLHHLTAGVRGEAAVKGITLDEAKRQANAIAIVAASDYGVAKPAITLVSRFANDVYDLGQVSERDRLAAFVSAALHRNDLAAIALDHSGRRAPVTSHIAS